MGAFTRLPLGVYTKPSGSGGSGAFAFAALRGEARGRPLAGVLLGALGGEGREEEAFIVFG